MKTMKHSALPSLTLSGCGSGCRINSRPSSITSGRGTDALMPWRAVVAVVLACASGLAAAQEAIVAIKVQPLREVINKSEWNQPVVIKTGEEAAGHFGKDALGALGRQIDFGKQFLLVFAWRGSGGDKLEYTVAESWPEQVSFTLQRGLTRDLREHTRVFAMRSNVTWRVDAAGGAKPPGDVRQIKFQALDDDFHIRLGGQGRLMVMQSAAEVEKLLGMATARQILADGFDFTKEKLVLVSWATSGPPEGLLKHEIMGAGEGRRVVFYVQGPVGLKQRGMRASFAADLFAVSGDLAVDFDKKERF